MREFITVIVLTRANRSFVKHLWDASPLPDCLYSLNSK